MASLEPFVFLHDLSKVNINSVLVERLPLTGQSLSVSSGTLYSQTTPLPFLSSTRVYSGGAEDRDSSGFFPAGELYKLLLFLSLLPSGEMKCQSSTKIRLRNFVLMHKQLSPSLSDDFRTSDLLLKV